MVEQRTENPCVPGSIPGGTTEREKRDSRMGLHPIAISLFFLTLSMSSPQPPPPFPMKPKEATLLYLLSTHFFTSTQASFYLYARALSASRGYYPLPPPAHSRPPPASYSSSLSPPRKDTWEKAVPPSPTNIKSEQSPPSRLSPDRKWATYTSIRIRKSIRSTRIARCGGQAKSKLDHRQDKGSTAR